MTITSKVVAIWSGLVLLGIPLAWVALNDISFVVQNIELLASIVLILCLSVSGWRLKRALKRRMEQGLGRAVDDNELVSITAWIKIPEEAAKAAREAERYDFNIKTR
jgi:hypothetical protein